MMGFQLFFVFLGVLQRSQAAFSSNPLLARPIHNFAGLSPAPYSAADHIHLSPKLSAHFAFVAARALFGAIARCGDQSSLHLLAQTTCCIVRWNPHRQFIAPPATQVGQHRWLRWQQHRFGRRPHGLQRGNIIARQPAQMRLQLRPVCTNHNHAFVLRAFF